jgi:hypothetical protein
MNRLVKKTIASGPPERRSAMRDGLNSRERSPVGSATRGALDVTPRETANRNFGYPLIHTIPKGGHTRPARLRP